MKIIYADAKTEKYCTDMKAATKLFGGKKSLTISLMSRITALDNADSLVDIIRTPIFHFHNLQKKKGRDLKGYYAIDVKGRRDGWRIILQPLDEEERPYKDTSIDQIATKVRIVEITEVSKHYE